MCVYVCIQMYLLYHMITNKSDIPGNFEQKDKGGIVN